MTVRTAEQCPVCNRGELFDEGRVVHLSPATVSGIPIDLGDADYRIVKCRYCTFRWKYPEVPADRLEYCYRSGHHSEEEPDPVTRSFDLIKSFLMRHVPGSRVLDVGCDTGVLLSYLGPSFDLYGVEPSEYGRTRALERGVKVLGPTFSGIDPHAEFDAILALDVIEHLLSPSEFVATAARHLVPGGVLLIVTGNGDAWSWRLHKSRYWYVSIPSHLSFVTALALREAGRSHGLVEVEYRRVSHRRVPAAAKLKDAFKGIAYWAARRLGAFENSRGPYWTSANDHLIHVMKKGNVTI